MDIIITAIGEFIWVTSCAVVNFCVSSGVSVLAVFVSFLCAILASAFYKYTITREQMSLDNAPSTLIDEFNDGDQLDEFTSILPTTTTTTTESPTIPLMSATSVDQSNNTNNVRSLTDIEIYIEETISENERGNANENNADHDQTSNDLLIDSIEGSEEEIQKQQIANIYRLLNNQNLINNWTTTDFLDQLKMYGLNAYDEDELQSP